VKGMKQNNQESPPCTITDLNKPNFELMAKAFLNLYNQTKKSVKVESA
jgi:hypothetical protein